MSLDPNTNRNDYVGNGATAIYDYDFKIFDKTHLLVKTRSVTNIESTLVLDTDYSVQDVGERDGGTITLLLGNLALNVDLTILGRMPIEQENNIGNQSSFYPSTIEEEFDKLAIVDQQQQEQIGRSLKLPDTIPSSAFNPALPANILDPQNKGKALVLNQTSNGLALSATNESGVPSFLNVAADETLNPDIQNYYFDTTLADRNAILPDATLSPGSEIFVMNSTLTGGNKVLVASAVALQLMGQSTNPLGAGEGHLYASNGVSWFVKY